MIFEKINKLVLLSFLVVIASFFTAVPNVFAVSNTEVRGNINANGWVSGLTVTVSCNGNVSHPVTDGFGLYVVDYTHLQCGKYKPVTTTVTFNGQTQSKTVLVSAQYTATLDFNFAPIGVPEFGLITGIITTLTSAGAFLMLRRKIA